MNTIHWKLLDTVTEFHDEFTGPVVTGLRIHVYAANEFGEGPGYFTTVYLAEPNHDNFEDLNTIRGSLLKDWIKNQLGAVKVREIEDYCNQVALTTAPMKKE